MLVLQETLRFDILDLHFFPSISNDVLKTVRPVISVDAAHLWSEFKGMLYVASVLSGGDDIYPIGFMIASGNEDRKTWTKMLRLLKEACPVICEQGFGTFNVQEDLNTHHRSKFLFISDRDKGLKPALKEVFPDHTEMCCAKHIEANVTTKFGRRCGKLVMAMAKTYSVRYFDTLLEQMRTLKPSAASYIENLTDRGILWSNSQWNNANEPLPPRFGIVTSNTAESVNSMFNSARDLPWMEALEVIIHVMITQISTCRKKYKREDGLAIVPRVRRLINNRWESTAAISVTEIEDGSDVFTTNRCDDGGVDDEEDENGVDNEEDENGSSRRVLSQNDQLPVMLSSTHTVNRELKTCTCGVWQDTLLPCAHACAVYRKATSADKNYILANLIDTYYTHGCVQTTFKKNIYPVSLNTVTYDGETKPPLRNKRSSGRPRTKRIRRRSLYAESEESPIVRSNCGRAGHNKRTCCAPPRDSNALSTSNIGTTTELHDNSTSTDERSTSGNTEL